MKRYKIKQFCQHMGVNQDTVKHYQQCGILNPLTDDTNNYRYYDITHGERLIVSRKFRNLGFSVDETKNLISQKNGDQITEMLHGKQEEIALEIKRLQNLQKSLDHMETLCELFNNKSGSILSGMRPSYYIYRHTYDFEFLEEGTKEPCARELMSTLPDVVKMMIVPYDTLTNRENKGFYHCLAIRETSSAALDPDTLQTMEFHKETPALIYVYSRPHSHKKFEFIHDLYLKLESDGFSLAKDTILIENATDFYVDGIRYENYLIYFPLL